MKLSREPASWINALSAVVALMVGLGAFGLTETTGAALIAVVSAVTSAIVALRVRPIAPTVLTGLITSGFAALAAFDLIHISTRNVGLAVTVAELLLTAVIIRPQSTPLSDPRPAEHSV